MYRLYGLALFCLLSIFGCKTEELKETAQHVDEKPNPNSFVVVGRLERGTIAGAQVSLHPIVNGSPSWAETLGTGHTDSNGDYTLEIESRHLGRPALLRAQVLANQSLITCDLTTTCGDSAAFGDIFTTNQDSELILAIPALQKNRRYNITAFSHTAYELVEYQGSMTSAVNGNALADIQLQHNIARANSQVASRFGIIGDLVSVELINITNRAEVESASIASLGNSLLGGALIAATMSANPALSFGDLVEEFAMQYVSSGVPGNSEIASVVSYAGVLDAAIAAVAYVQPLYQRDFSGLVSEFSVAKGLAATEEADQFGTGTASETSSLTSVEKAKSFVNDIRRIALSIDLRKIVSLSNLSEFIDGKAADALAQFGLQLDAAEILQGEQADQIFVALAKVTEAILNAIIEYYGNGEVLPSHGGLPFSHSVSGDQHTFVFRSTHDFCGEEAIGCPTALSLVVKLNIADFGGNVGSQLIAAAYMDVQIVGTISYDDLTLRFPENYSPVKISNPMFRLQNRSEGDVEISSYLVRGENVEGQVPIFVEKNDETGLVVSGIVALEAEKLWAAGQNSKQITLESDSGGRSTVQERSLSVRELKGFKMDVAASVRNFTNETFLGAINVMQGEKNLSEVVSWKNSYTEYCADDKPAGSCEEVSSETVIEGETAENFLALNASVGFKANLKGISTPVVIDISGSRSSPTTNTINSMKVSYPGHAVSLNGRFNNKGGIVALSATNLDGMYFFMDTVNGKRAGAVETPAKEKVADVIDMGQWIKIRYLDGFFESL